MKFQLALSALVALTSAMPATHQLSVRTTVDPSLVPDFGVTAGVPSSTSPGSCVGANQINIPCACPPDRGAFIAVVQQFVDAGSAFGTPVSWPTGDSSDEALTRINTLIVSLQNSGNAGPGVGCPLTSAPNFSAIQRSLLSS